MRISRNSFKVGIIPMMELITLITVITIISYASASKVDQSRITHSNPLRAVKSLDKMCSSNWLGLGVIQWRNPARPWNQQLKQNPVLSSRPEPVCNVQSINWKYFNWAPPAGRWTGATPGAWTGKINKIQLTSGRVNKRWWTIAEINYLLQTFNLKPLMLTALEKGQE